MTETVTYAAADGLAVIGLANKPGNTLDRAQRAALTDALARAEDDPVARAVLFETDLANFCAGDSLNPGEDVRAAPSLADLCLRVERCAKPVIVALKGATLGGGFDLALAAHFRIAPASARLGFPAVSLGLPPAGGGVQRLMRSSSVEPALKLLLTGTPIAAPEAAEIGIVDRIAEASLGAAARAYATELIADGTAPRRAGEVEGFFAQAAQGMAAVAEARSAMQGSRMSGPARILDCAEAGFMMPYDAALAFEGEAYAECVDGQEAGALMHVARIERHAAGAVRQGPPLRALGVVGEGQPAADLAAAALGRGLDVVLFAEDSGAAVLRDLVLSGLDGVQPGEGRVGQLLMTVELEDLRTLPALAVGVESARQGLGIVSETVTRLLPLDRPILTLSAASLLPALVAATDGGAALVGLSFGGRAATGRLLELIVTPDTSDEARAAAMGLARALGRFAVAAERKPIGSTVTAAARRAAEVLVQNGTPLGNVATEFGWFGLSPDVLIGLQEANDPEGVLAGIGPEEIRHRLLTAMANAGAQLLNEGCAAKPAEIDLCMVHGQGFARWLGGPMLAADRMGLFRIEQLLLRYAADGPEIWTPDPLFRELVKNGHRFDALN